MEVTIKIHKESGSYWSEIQELPGCFASGWTLEELHEALQETLCMYLDDPGLKLIDPQLHVGDVTVVVRPG
jgi:predicted RNase H-like HicB family nuclease